MKNYVQRGERLRLYPTGSVTAGQIVVVGGIVGVAFSDYDIATGDGVICDLYGVYDLPKITGAWTQGVPVYWDADNKQATTVADGNTYIGLAADVAVSDAEFGSVLVNGNSGATFAASLAALTDRVVALEQ